MNVISTIKKIKEVATSNHIKPKSQKVHNVTKDSVPVGTCFRQGDLYVFRVEDTWNKGETVEVSQIADGVSLGSRHILKGKFTVYKGTTLPDNISDLNKRGGIGYCFDAEAGVTLTHPEHDHFKFVDGGRFQVLHQMDMRTLKRVAD